MFNSFALLVRKPGWFVSSEFTPLFHNPYDPWCWHIYLHRTPIFMTQFCSLCQIYASTWSLSHILHVWHIYLHLVHFWGKCRYIYHTWSLWVTKCGSFTGQNVPLSPSPGLQILQTLQVQRLPADRAEAVGQSQGSPEVTSTTRGALIAMLVNYNFTRN